MLSSPNANHNQQSRMEVSKPPNPEKSGGRSVVHSTALIVLVLFPLIILTLSLNKNSLSPANISNIPPKAEVCELFKGEWVADPDGPRYTNDTCWAIHEHQNCIKYGRPDRDFMSWRWNPHGPDCHLPVFDPHRFLRLLTGKFLAFVGDSVARNQMQSLICLLSQVEYPIDRSNTTNENFKLWHYSSYNFTLAMYTSTFLVRSSMEDPGGPTNTGVFGLHLDEVDHAWARHIDSFDHLVISSGHWFFRSLLYYRNSRLIGCRFCRLPNLTDLSIPFGYRAVFRTSFRAILDCSPAFQGTVYLRTFAPSHFEGGDWNTGGSCERKKPFRSNETMLQGMHFEMYRAQVDEFRDAQREGRTKGVSFRLLDTTQAMLLRPDGHPSKYGHWPNEKVVLYNDCVHWCLPGPIDVWNDFLLQIMTTDGQNRDGE